MAPCRKNNRGETLKNEGNALHQKGKYRAAYHKYTEAIKEDPNNANYYANRAACSLAVKEYMDACTDAEKATELDKNYGKAWARLGMAQFALARWQASIDAWKTALACLPPPGQCTESDERLHAQFNEGLQKAENALKVPDNPFKQVISKDQKMPWQKAEEMIDELREKEKVSSAFVILYAYWDFKTGVAKMKELTEKPSPTGEIGLFGSTEALVGISNGLMRDHRALHLDCPDWFEKYNQQVIFECDFFQGWERLGAKAVIEKLPKKQKRDGWASTRRALAMTIRAWINCGIFAVVSHKYVVAVEYQSRAIEVLDWGSRVWENVPIKDRGCIFEWSFIRGVKRLQIMAIHQALANGAEGCALNREELAEQCRDLIAESEAHPPPGGTVLDVGFLLSFWDYPRAEALAILGWCHMQTGLETNDSETASSDFAQAAELYWSAAMSLPPDEEKSVSFGMAALDAYWFGNKPAKEIMVLTQWISDQVPIIDQIWEHSPLARPRNARISHVMNFVTELAQAKDEGRITDESIVKPQSMKSQDKWAAPDVIYI